MSSHILSIGTALPNFSYTQEEIASSLIHNLGWKNKQASFLKKIFSKAKIQRRYSVLPDFKLSNKGLLFDNSLPSTAERNAIYKKEAPKLAHKAAFTAIDRWGGKAEDITHVISVSCTGMTAPGIECSLVQSLKLNPSVNRLGINFMGCFGAFKGLSIADSLAKNNPKHRILLVCTELCSLHFQTGFILDNIIGNALFADGAAAVIVGCHPYENEKPLWAMKNHTSFLLENSSNEMTWEIGDTGFLMKLSKEIPQALSENIRSFVHTLSPELQQNSACNWAVHPGGKAILEKITDALDLPKESIQPSWDTLSSHGNMSSATFLFVLERTLEHAELHPLCCGLGFGPGLSIEGVLLQRGHA